MALQKRKAVVQKQISSHGLDETAKELLETNRQDRIRMEEEIEELRQRNEKRKKQREQEEKRLAAERAAEEDRRKAVEEEKRRKKDEEDKRKQQERAKKMAEFEKWKNPTGRNFVISRKSETGEDDEEEESGDNRESGRKSKEQLEAEKKAILKQRIQTLEISGFDKGKLTEKAKELHKLIYRLEGEKYDLEKRFKVQQIDMMELAERARQANKVGKGGLKRIQTGSDDVDKIQERFAGTPAKIEMYSKYERQKDKRPYVERKNQYTGPQFLYPPDRIPPKKVVKWNEEGLPMYDVLEEGAKGHAEPTAA